jgi:nucleotide-binding universal stress UspA family protein
MARRGFNRFLAGSDGAEAGEHAVELARTLAARIGARLEVLSVETAGLPELAATGSRLHRTGPASDVHWISGIPGFEIVHWAERAGAELVVLGREERCPQNPLPLGRTADTVVRRRDGACLLVPPAVRTLDRMVLALDGTRRGLGILEPAAALAAALKSECLAVHVCPRDPVSISLESCWTDPAVERAREALAAFPELGNGSCLQVRRGVPVSEILAFLDQNRADLLVLGVRRGGPRGEMGSGHVGQDLLRTAPTAILTVPI